MAVQQWIKRANKKIPVGWAAALISASSAVSMVLGLLRERLLNANFGVDSLELDAYRAAFTVPDFMFFILVSGALSVTFIPVLKERLQAGNKPSAWELTNSLLNFLGIITFVASILIMLFADPIVRHVVAPSMDEAGIQLAASMMRIIAINPFLFAISSIFTSIQQAVGRFFFYAMAPATYNIGIISGIIWFSPHLGIEGVAYGVVFGSILQLLVGVLGLAGLGYNYKAVINRRNFGFRRVLRLLPARSLDQGMDYFLNLVEINRASRLGQGMINMWQTAFTLHFVPINLVGIAISTAAFPKLSERIAQGRPDLFKKEFRQMLRIIIWLALATVVVAYFVRGYLVRLMVGEGNPTIAALLALMTIAIFFRSMFHIVSRGFYAQQDTKTPFIVSLFAIGLNVALAVWWAVPRSEGGFSIFGLALAQSVTAAIEVIVLVAILTKRFPGLLDRDFVFGVTTMLSAAGLTSVVTYALVRILPLNATDVGFVTLMPKFTIIVSSTLITYAAFSYMLNIREARPIVDKVLQAVFRTAKV